MKLFLRILNIVFYFIMIILLTAALGSAITKKPMLMTAVRSNSMYPLFERGDAVFVKTLSSDAPVKIGDIVIFKTDKGSLTSQGWIMHRIVGGNADEGFFTKGDANERSDQENGGAGLIKREFIASRVITFAGVPLKIPLLGYLTLYMEQFQQNPFTLPFIAIILAVVIGISELSGNKKKQHKKNDMSLPMIYFFSGLTIIVIVGATMLATSQHLVMKYEVSETSEGIIMGSDVGILKLGDTAERPLVTLNNKGFFPIIAAISCHDPQFSFNHEKIKLRPGDEIEISISVTAKTPGKYSSSIWVGMFFPILPIDLIYSLSKINFWLAFAVISIIPGLPVMLYPFIDTRMRIKTIKQIRREFRRMKRVISF